MDPVRKLWMYENWVSDQEDQAELAKNHAFLLGSFWNPEAVKQLTGGGNVYESTEEDLDASTRLVREMNLQLLKKKDNPDIETRRQRHHLKD